MQSPHMIRSRGLALIALCASIPMISAFAYDLSRDKVQYVVNTSHLDTQWKWTIEQTTNKYIPKTIRDNFSLFKTYPGFVFNFEGAWRYMVAKKTFPSAYDSLKAIYVPSGNWAVAGSMVEACDVNVPSAEALVRQVLYGNGFFQDEFGKRSLDIFLPDCFGFGYVLPTVATHCGLKGFSTQKLKWGSAYGIPFPICRWRGVDGSEIVAVLDAGDYGSCFDQNLRLVSAQGAAIPLNIGYNYAGPGGDMGGGIDPSCASQLMQRVAQNVTNGTQVICSRSDQLFRDLLPAQIASLPVYNGELVMKTHGVGCYTHHGDIKMRNNACEQTAYAAEGASVLGEWATNAQTAYPRQQFKDAWIQFLWHQFHDDLTGTSIDAAYVFSRKDQDNSLSDFGGAYTRSVQAISTQIDTRASSASAVSVFVFNTLSMDRADIAEVDVTMPGGTQSARVYDTAGVEIPSQVLSGSNGNFRMAFIAQAPSVGGRMYEVRPASSPCAMATGVSASATVLENRAYRISINGSGDISSIIDKRMNNRELLSAPMRLELRPNNTTNEYAQWEINWEDVNAVPQGYVDENVSISVKENGPARAAVEVRRSKFTSNYVQTYRLIGDSAGSYLEVLNEIDWNRAGNLLSATFPLTAGNTKSTFDLGLGTISRPVMNDGLYEVPGQQWADLTDAGNTFGVTVLSEYKRGWEMRSANTLNLTLIHSPNRGGGEYRDPAKYALDVFHHSFRYGLSGHAGDWKQGLSVLQAARFNQPLKAMAVTQHDGRLGKSFSFFKANANIMLMALKKSERSEEYVARVREINGQSGPGTKCFFGANITAAREVDGQEDSKGAVSSSGNALTFDISAYQPRAFAVTLSSAPGQISLGGGLDHIQVSPPAASIARENSLQMKAIAQDQYNAAMPVQPMITWTIDGGQTITQQGIFKPTATGTFTITASATVGQVTRQGTSRISVGAGCPLPAGPLMQLLVLETATGSPFLDRADIAGIEAKYTGTSPATPGDGVQTTVNGHAYTWRLRTCPSSSGYWCEGGSDPSVSYFFVDVISPAARQVKVSSIQAMDAYVWNNGVLAGSMPCAWSDRVPVLSGAFTLAAGENRFLMKNDETATVNGYFFSARIVDPSGQDVTGLEYLPCSGAATPTKSLQPARNSTTSPVQLLNLGGGVVRVRIGLEGKHAISILDARGRIVRHVNGEGIAEYRFDRNALGSGAYIVKIVAGSLVQREWIVVQ